MGPLRMAVASEELKFDVNFWISKVRELGYPVKEEELSVKVLRERGVIPQGADVRRVLRLYVDDYVECAIVEFGNKMTRSLCTRIARSWKKHRLGIRPLLAFTDGTDSYMVTIPGPGSEGEARVLWLHERLYRTDNEVIKSLEYRGDPEKTREAYDKEFLPYERVREEFFEEYRKLYEEIVNVTKSVLREEASSYAQRFLGRLMFLYFLQRKRWLKGDKRFIDKISDYFELNRVFYRSLSEGLDGLPFLNGSVFEREEYLTEEVEKRLAKEMNAVFLRARRLFNEYNFTVDESSPLEVEVSIDPLLLGTVLENMLPEHERG
ncbi:MAG: hypothetical protein ABDH63_07105, partial [Candidatus Caldarchaeales archaeon]